MQRHPDPLTNFSHRLAQIKFIVFEIVLLVVFLFFLLKVLIGELGITRPANDPPRTEPASLVFVRTTPPP